MPCVDAWAASDDDDAGDDSREDDCVQHVSDADVERRKHHNAGYLEGLEEGKAETIQSGFNEGFLDGGKAGFAYGQLKGAARSLRIFGGQVSGSETWAATIKDSEEYFTKTTTVRALKAAHAESLDDEVRDFTNALSAVQTAVESTGVVLRKYPEGSSSTA